MMLGITLQVFECNLFACVPGAATSLIYCIDDVAPRNTEIDETISFAKEADHNSFFMNPTQLENV